MSKTYSPPSKEKLDSLGIRFVPTNCYSPNHWAVKHLVFPFDNFDTYLEHSAINKASLVNSLARSLEQNNLLKDKDALIPAFLRMAGFTD